MSLLTSQIGCVITLIFGVWAFVKPANFARIVSLTPYKKEGITEMRATYGGWIIGLAIFGLINQTETVFFCIAFAWFGAAIGRFISVVIDRSSFSKGLSLITIELLTGVLLIY